MNQRNEHDPSPLERLDSEDAQAIAANIERYLNNHTREGGHAWQMNMAARPQTWHPLEASQTDTHHSRPEA
jgi:hypothetical protein